MGYPILYTWETIKINQRNHHLLTIILFKIAVGLSKVNKHNLREYTGDKSNIFIICGSDNLVADTKKIYLQEFEQSRLEYNNKQTRDDRKIHNYFNHVDKNSNRDLACELILQLGDMDFWADKQEEYKYKMIDVFTEQIQDLQKIVPEFKVANAVIHFDECSPHLHIVGVPIKDGYKNGMKKQVAKSQIFTKESLTKLQDKMREGCIRSFNKAYNADYQLQTKEKGRNIDIPVSKMQGYSEFRKQKEQNKKLLQQANEKTDVLADKTEKIDNIIKELKQPTLSKKHYVIPVDSIDTIKEYIKEVKTTTKAIRNVNDLDVILTTYENDLYEQGREIKSLKHSIEQKDNTIEKLSNNLTTAQDTISKQKTKINFLQEQLSVFKNLWNKLKHKFQMRVRFDRDEHFTKVTEELHSDKIFTNEDVERIHTGTAKNMKKKNYEL